MDAAESSHGHRTGGDFERLVREHHALVHEVCRRVLHRAHDVEDAAQETFLKLWRARAERTTIQNVGAWLRVIAAGVAVDFMRRRDLRGDDRRLRPVLMEKVEATTPLDLLARGELESDLRDALARLPAGQRAIFELKHDAGWSLSEVASLLGVSMSTVKTQFARACLRLQGALHRHHWKRDER